jgi:uroporphyrinogen-III decarboxylase
MAPYGDPDMSGRPLSAIDIHDNRHEYQSTSEIDARAPVLPSEALLRGGSWDLPAQVVADYGKEYFLGAIVDTPFFEAYNHLGFEGLMISQREQPDLLSYLLRRKLAQGQSAAGAWAQVGIHGLFAEETFTGADTISPRSYDRFVFALNAPFFSHIRQAGLLSIHYVCGDVRPRLPRLVELEIDAVAVEESKKGFQLEIDDIVDRVGGRCAVLGNIDAVRYGLNTPLDAMAAETRRQAQVGARAKGFIASTGSPFPLDTNPRLLDTLVATAHALPVRQPGGAGGHPG